MGIENFGWGLVVVSISCLYLTSHLYKMIALLEIFLDLWTVHLYIFDCGGKVMARRGGHGQRATIDEILTKGGRR